MENKMKEGDKKIISNPTLRADCLLCVLQQQLLCC